VVPFSVTCGCIDPCDVFLWVQIFVGTDEGVAYDSLWFEVMVTTLLRDQLSEIRGLLIFPLTTTDFWP
jgi:hypothetical protein